jgi:hypothetical protein
VIATHRYEKDDWIAEVELLEDLGEGLIEAYCLRVVRTVQPSQVFGPISDGTKFTVDQQRHGHPIWRLTRLVMVPS